MDVTIKNGKLTIVADIDEKPEASASGKSLVLFSTRGNMVTNAQHGGKPVIVGLNVYIKADKKK